MNTESATTATTEPRQSTLGNPRTVALIAAGGLMIGAALPWATVHTGFGSISVSGFDGDGVFTAILGLLGALAVLSIKGWRRWAALACGALSVGVGLNTFINVSQAAAEDSEYVKASVGSGLYLTIAAGVVMAVVALKAKTTQVEATS